MKQALALFVLNLIVFTFASNTGKISLIGLSGFKCYGITNIETPIRMTNNNKIECFSLDGKKCVNQLNSDSKCREFVGKNIGKLIPITCDSSNHKESLCQEARSFFFKKWHCSGETGLNTGIRLNEKSGDVECLSLNGKDCIWGTEGDKICEKIQTSKKIKEMIRPLSCGYNDNKLYSANGYFSNEGHWCKIGWAYFRYTGRWLCKKHTGLDTPIRLSDQGEVECASSNGRDCYWGMGSNKKCMNLILQQGNNFKSLECGNKHKHHHGGSGYSKNGHWCKHGLNLFYEKKINLIGETKLSIPKKHIYRKVQKNQDIRNHREFKTVFNKMRNQLVNKNFLKIIRKWGTRNKVNLASFWLKVKLKGWRFAIKNTSWFKRFVRSNNKKGIKIYEHLNDFILSIKTNKEKIVKLRNSILQRINRNHIPYLSNRVFWNIFKILSNEMKNNRISKLLLKFTKITKKNIISFWRDVLKSGLNDTIARTKWWSEFIKFCISRKINFEKLYKRFVSKYRSIKKRNKHKFKAYIYHGANGKKILWKKYTKSSWKILLKRIEITKFWLMLNFYSKGKIDTIDFLRKIRMNGWNNAVDSSEWWHKFIKYLKKREKKNNKKIINEVKRIFGNWRRNIKNSWNRLVRKYRTNKIKIKINKSYRKKIVIGNSHWKTIVNLLKDTRFYRAIKYFNNTFTVNIRDFFQGPNKCLPF